jgi:hypothetical protein
MGKNGNKPDCGIVEYVVRLLVAEAHRVRGTDNRRDYAAAVMLLPGSG